MTRLQEALDDIRADDALKEKTTRAVLLTMKKDAKPRRKRRFIPVVALVTCLLAVVGIGGHQLYFTPTTVLSIDINPSLEMDINRFDRVIALNGYNEDGVALAETLDVKNKSYDDAVDTLMADDTIEACLARGEELSIAVVQADDKDPSQSDAVMQYVSDCTAQHANAHCYSMESSEAQMTDAHNAGLSCGKYHIYQTLLAYDPTITPEAVQQMTMRELRDLLAQYEGETTAASDGNGRMDGNADQNGCSQGNGNGGQGAGNGGHHGWRQGGHHGNGHD